MTPTCKAGQIVVAVSAAGATTKIDNILEEGLSLDNRAPIRVTKHNKH